MVGFLAAIIAVIGWVVVHRTGLTRDREARDYADRKEKEARRSELLSTLKHWENTFVIVPDPTKLGTLYYEEGGMRALAEAAEKFRGYVTDKNTFDRLNHQMSAMNPQTLDASGKDQRRETICGSIRAFYDFNRNS
jgi:hypothetical protein